MSKTAYFRFYEELNDFLFAGKRKVKFPCKFQFKVSVKDIIESLGVPHAEVDLILVNGKSVDFNYVVNDGDEISVYPVFESFDISDIQHLRAKPLREPKFVLDVHLGTLARYLRMIGLDAAYQNNYNDEEIVKISGKEKRAILTKDLGILKRNEVTHGYYVWNISPEEQLREVIERFHLENEMKVFSRCLECNEPLNKAEKCDVIERLPEKVKQYHNEFFTCPKCYKVFWKGTHYDNMKKILARIGY